LPEVTTIIFAMKSYLSKEGVNALNFTFSTLQ
jgi:hypothetical protein